MQEKSEVVEYRNISTNKTRGLQRLKYLYTQLNYFVIVSLIFTTAYLLVTSLMFNKKSIIIFALLNLYSKFFSGRFQTYINIMTSLKPEKWFNKFEFIIEEELDQERCLLPYHPHSIWPLCLLYSNHMPNSPIYNIQVLASRQLCYLAPHGLIMRFWNLDSIDPLTCKKYMKKGVNLSFVPGGFEEATMTSTKEYRLFIKKRKGFIKFALKYKYKVYPLFVFNENKMYNTSDFILKQRVRMNKYKIPSALFWSLFFVPSPNVDIYVVIGKPLVLPHIHKPTKDDVVKYHNLYMEHVRELFNRHVDRCDPGATLKFDDEVFAQKPRL